MSADLLLGNFHTLAEAPKGVQKLRELILSLAVQGKLVPQDQNDEPCDKKELSAMEPPRSQAKGRTGADLGEVTAAVSGEIPTSWVWARLFRLCAPDAPIVYGILQPGPDVRPDGVPYVRPTEIKRGKILLDDVRHTVDEIATRYERSRVKTGDILLTIVGTLGATAVVPHELDGGNITQSSCRIRPNKKLVDPAFLVHCLQSPLLVRQYEGFSLGSAVRRLNIAHVRALVIPLPPLAEQSRIVSKVDQLMAFCDELEKRQEKKYQVSIQLNESALNRLTTFRTPEEFAGDWQRIKQNFDLLYDTPENVGKLKQAILQIAVQGKLVPQNPNDEPASVLLERLDKEKERLRKEGELRQTSQVAPIAIEEIDHELPKGWAWCRFGQLIDCFRGHNPPKHLFVPEPRKGYVRFIQITDFKTDKSAVYVPESRHLKRVYRGEILMAAYRHIGKLSRNVEGAFNVACCKIMELRPMERDFIELLIGTDFVRGALLEASGRAHIPSMHTDHLLSLVVPLPPLAEQRRIVVRHRCLMTICDELETKLTRTQSAAERLVEAVVREVVAEAGT